MVFLSFWRSAPWLNWLRISDHANLQLKRTQVQDPDASTVRLRVVLSRFLPPPGQRGPLEFPKAAPNLGPGMWPQLKD